MGMMSQALIYGHDNPVKTIMSIDVDLIFMLSAGCVENVSSH